MKYWNENNSLFPVAPCGININALVVMCVTSPKVVVVVATWNKYGMRSHAGAWERD